MHRCPFQNERLCPPWQRPPEHSNRLNPDYGALPTIARMHMWWRMLSVKHTNLDTIEPTNRRQIVLQVLTLEGRIAAPAFRYHRAPNDS
jgi:hypothetical protein